MTSTKPSAVVFDIGNVIIGWNPRNLYENHFDDKDELTWFLDEVVNLKWHTEHDRGLSFAEGCERRVKQFPKYEKQIHLFNSHWRQTITGPINGTVALIKRLAGGGVPLFALSNYSAEKFPQMLEEFTFMELFKDIVISGSVGSVKPESEIFELAMEKFNLSEGQALFVDDRQENISAGERFGLIPHHFTTPENLEADLKHYSLLS